MKKLVTTTLAAIALSLLAGVNSGQAAGLGVTSHHQYTGTVASLTHTGWTVPNNTIYDQAVIHGPDGGIVYGPLTLHKALTGAGTLIGTSTPKAGGAVAVASWTAARLWQHLPRRTASQSSS